MHGRIQVFRLFKKYYDTLKNVNEFLNQSSMVTSASIEGASPIDSDFAKRETKSHKCNKHILNVGNNTSEERNYVLTLPATSTHLITHRIKVIDEITTSSVNIYTF